MTIATLFLPLFSLLPPLRTSGAWHMSEVGSVEYKKGEAAGTGHTKHQCFKQGKGHTELPPQPLCNP